MENINKILSANLIKYRTLNGLTQVELAEKINYSDKSVSKWERGESLPDVLVLTKLCEIYKITMNDLFDAHTITEKEFISFKQFIHKRWFITLLSGVLVWFIAALTFAVLYMIPETQNIAWFSFIYAVPVCGIVLTVFSSLWGNVYTHIVSTSIIDLGLILSLCLSLNNITSYIWMLFLAGGIFEILIIFWFIFYNKYKKKKENKKMDN